MDVAFDFTDKNFVVTGASSGIAHHLAGELARANARILAIARREHELKCLKDRYPEHIFIAPLDVCDGQLMEDKITEFVGSYGKLNGSVHAAGFLSFTPLRAFDINKAKKMMDVNLWAGFKLLEIVTKRNIAASHSSHVQISSVNSYKGQKGLSAYCAVKAAVRAGVRAASKELAEKGIRVNSISPGVVNTPMTDSLPAIDFLLKEYPLGCGNTGDIAGIIMFLLSEKARWITGTDIIVDGGYLA